jgi:hypothetical protein
LTVTAVTSTADDAPTKGDGHSQNLFREPDPMPAEATLVEQAEWYLFKNERQYGPLSLNDLRRYVEQKLLLANDLVWRTGFETWICAVEVSELFPIPHNQYPSK